MAPRQKCIKRPDPLDAADPAVQQSIQSVWRQQEAVGIIYLINPKGGALAPVVRPPHTLQLMTASMPSPMQEAPSHASKL